MGGRDEQVRPEQAPLLKTARLEFFVRQGRPALLKAAPFLPSGERKLIEDGADSWTFVWDLTLMRSSDGEGSHRIRKPFIYTDAAQAMPARLASSSFLVLGLTSALSRPRHRAARRV